MFSVLLRGAAATGRGLMVALGAALAMVLVSVLVVGFTFLLDLLDLVLVVLEVGLLVFVLMMEPPTGWKRRYWEPR